MHPVGGREGGKGTPFFRPSTHSVRRRSGTCGGEKVVIIFLWSQPPPSLPPTILIRKKARDRRSCFERACVCASFSMCVRVREGVRIKIAGFLRDTYVPQREGKSAPFPSTTTNQRTCTIRWSSAEGSQGVKPYYGILPNRAAAVAAARCSGSVCFVPLRRFEGGQFDLCNLIGRILRDSERALREEKLGS